MANMILLSTAYSWFIGLLVIMVVMAALFVFIAVFALKPYKLEEINGDDSPLRLLDNREAELATQLLSVQKGSVDHDEIELRLREVASAKLVVKELVERERGVSERKVFGIDNSLTAEQAASLDSDEYVSIEKTFDSADESGLKKSFSANLIQSGDEIKVLYFELKNCILCYEKTKARMGWYNEKFYIGRNNVATLTLRGKTLCLYLALSADEYSDRFPVKQSMSQMYKDVTPCLFRIKNSKGLKLAKELIALLMADYGVMYVKTNHSIYALPYEDDDALVARGLAKQADEKSATEN